MSDYVFPQFNDYDDPQNFAFHLGQSNLGDFVEYGLSLTADHSAETFDVGEGKAYVLANDAVGDASGETRHRLNYAVHVDATADVDFATTSGVNYVWLDANLGSQDSPQIVVETNDAAPSDASLKLGTIDAANDTAAVETNREPDATFASLTTDAIDVPSGGPITASANLDLNGYQAKNVNLLGFADKDGDGTKWEAIERSDNGALRFGHGATDYLRLYPGGPARVLNAGLQLPRGESILDDLGNARIDIDASRTEVNGDNGTRFLELSDGSYHRQWTYGDSPWEVFDGEGTYTAFSYQPSASAPGDLDLTNAFLQNVEIRSTRSGKFWHQTLPNSSGRHGQDNVKTGNINANGNEEILLSVSGNRATGLMVVTYYDRIDGGHLAELLIWAGVNTHTVLHSEYRGSLSVSPSYGFDAGGGDNELTVTLSHDNDLDYSVRFIGHA